MKTTSSNDEITTAKEAVDKAKEATQKIQKYIDTANKAMIEGRSVSKIAELATILDGVGKLGFVFGAISAGLELAALLSDQKSPEQQIMEMIQDVSSEVLDLKSEMKAQFEEMKDFVQITSVNTAIISTTAVIDTMTTMMNNYRKYLGKPEDAAKLAAIEQQLLDGGSLENYRSQVRNAISEVVNQIESALGSKNYFEALEDLSFGDYRKINLVGKFCLAKITAALQIEGFLDGIKYRDKYGEDKDALVKASLGEAADYYIEKHKRCCAFIKKAIKAVTDEDNASGHAIKYCDRKAFPALQLGSGKQKEEFETAALSLVNDLSARWPWCRWTAIVYEPVSTYDYHGVAEEWLYRWRIENDAQAKFNVVIQRISYDAGGPRPLKVPQYLKDAVSLSKTTKSDTSRALDFKKALNAFEANKKNNQLPSTMMMWLSKHAVFGAKTSDDQYFYFYPLDYDSHYDYNRSPNMVVTF